MSTLKLPHVDELPGRTRTTDAEGAERGDYPAASFTPEWRKRLFASR